MNVKYFLRLLKGGYVRENSFLSFNLFAWYWRAENWIWWNKRIKVCVLSVPTRFLSERNSADENIVVYCKFCRESQRQGKWNWKVWGFFNDEDANHLAFENFPTERSSKLVLLQLSICPKHEHTSPSQNVYN